MINKLSKNKIMGAAIIVLLLVNAGLLIFFFCCKGENRGHKPGNGREAMAKVFLKKDIGFSEAQLQQYDSLSKQHRESVKVFFEEMRSNKEKSFKDLGANGFSDSIIDLTATQASAKQKEMDIKMFQHFKSIRALCTNEQLPRFDSLFYKMVTKRKPDNK